MKHRNVQSTLTILLGAAIFLFGSVCNVFMFVTRSYPTLGFFYLMGLGAVVASLGIWGRRNWIVRDRPLGFFKRNIAIISLLGIAALCITFMTFTNVKHRVAHTMTWRRGKSDNLSPPHTHVVLSFVDYPGHVVGIYSADLCDYLESRESDQVSAVFEVTSNFGRMIGYNVVQIGDLTDWRSKAGYGRVKGPSKPSPWD